MFLFKVTGTWIRIHITMYRYADTKHWMLRTSPFFAGFGLVESESDVQLKKCSSLALKSLFRA